MLTAGTVWAALVTYVLMLAAFRYAKQRTFHVLIMISVILFDLGMPIYLYLYKDWYRRSDNSVRIDHRAQGKALLLVRALVIFTGALLVES